MISNSVVNPAHRFAATIASGACCLAASTGVASAAIVTFENPPPLLGDTPYGWLNVRDSVDGFSFTSTGNMPNNDRYAWRYYTPCAYLSANPAFAIGANGTTAIYSGNYNRYGLDAAYWIGRTDGSLWSFNQAVFTGLKSVGNIHLVGFRNGIEIFRFAHSISNTQQTVVSMGLDPDAANWIDTLKITNEVPTPYWGSEFIMDDMQYTLPAPGVFAMIGIAACGIRRRRCRN